MNLIKSAQQAKVRFKDIFQKIKGIIFFNELLDLEQQFHQTLSRTKTSKKFVKKSKMQKMQTNFWEDYLQKSCIERQCTIKRSSDLQSLQNNYPQRQFLPKRSCQEMRISNHESVSLALMGMVQ